MVRPPLSTSIERIENAISSMHFTNRTVASAYGTGLSVIGASILVELRGDQELSAKQLSKRIALSPVAISRALTKLEEQGLIKRKKLGRHVQSTITSEGNRVFNAAHAQAVRTFSEAYARLPKTLRNKFGRYIKLMADNLNAPPAALLDNDAPFMESIRRITRAFGFVSTSIYHYKEVTPLEWHILRAIALRVPGGAAITAQTLATDMGVSRNTVFSSVRRMVKRGHLSQAQSERDARERPLILLPKGRRMFEQGRRAARRLVQESVRGFSSAECEELAVAWEMYSGIHDLPSREVLLKGFEILIVETEELQFQARAALVRYRAASQALSSLPSDFINPNHLNFLLLEQDEIAAVIEISPAQVLHFVDGPNGAPRKVLHMFVSLACSKASDKFGRKFSPSKPQITREACTANCWKILDE